MRCRDHSDRRSFGKGSKRVECADPGANIGAAGDHGLLGFASALGIENLQHEPVLLEEAGILPQLRKGILPRPCQSPGNAQLVLRDGDAIQADKKRERRHYEPETKLDHFPSSTPLRDAIRSTEQRTEFMIRRSKLRILAAHTIPFARGSRLSAGPDGRRWIKK